MAGSGSPPRDNLAAYWALLRPQNIPPSFFLVATGATVSTHTFASLLDYKVQLTMGAAALVAVGSCVLNDLLDLEVDTLNKPDRPLVTGEVPTWAAEAIALACLAGALLAGGLVHPAALQGVILAAVGLVSVYTQILKPIPLLKTATVAAIISGAIAAGGLAAGAGLSAIVVPVAVTFCGTAHREILMDIADVEGDASAGVNTLPVLMGRGAALALALGLLALGIGGACAYLLLGPAPAGLTPTALLAAFSVPMFVNGFRVGRSEFDPQQLSKAVDFCLVPLFLILGLLGMTLGQVVQ